MVENNDFFSYATYVRRPR